MPGGVPSRDTDPLFAGPATAGTAALVGAAITVGGALSPLGGAPDLAIRIAAVDPAITVVVLTVGAADLRVFGDRAATVRIGSVGEAIAIVVQAIPTARFRVLGGRAGDVALTGPVSASPALARAALIVGDTGVAAGCAGGFAVGVSLVDQNHRSRYRCRRGSSPRWRSGQRSRT